MNTRSAAIPLSLVFSAWALVLTGCGGGLKPVHGKVTLPDGQPAAGSLVVFESEGEGNALTARGEVQADGSYRLGTLQPGDGVPPGKYRVLIAPPAAANAEAPTRPPFPAKYSDFQTSGLEYQVTTDKDNEFQIQLVK